MMQQRVIAIDPGNEQSAWVAWDRDPESVVACGIQPNREILDLIDEDQRLHGLLCIEEIASYGMAVGKEVFRTCYWYGRFAEAWYRTHNANDAMLIERRVVKLHHCHSARATDANISQALKDRFGQPGTKKSPGKLFGIKSHLWAALALAVCIGDRLPIETPADRAMRHMAQGESIA